MSPIDNISDELLIEILWLLALSSKPSKRYRISYGDCQYSEWGFLTVTHVCGHWRRVALSEPKLWTLIDLASPIHAINLCIERSKNVLLRVFGITNFHDDRSTISKAAITAVCQSSERIACLLSVKGASTIISPLLSSISNQRMPNIHELDLTLTDNHKAAESSVDPTLMPQLTSLVLEGITPVLSPNCFYRLQKLKINLPTDTHNLSLEPLLDALGNSVHLQELSLTWNRPSDKDSWAFGTFSPRHFQALHHINIDLPKAEQVHRLLSNITTPQGQDLHFVIRTEISQSLTEVVPPHFLTVLPQPSSSSERYFVLDIDFINTGSIRILVCSDREASPRIFFALHITGVDSLESKGQALDEIVQMFGLVRIKGLSIRDSKDQNGVSYWRLFGAFPDVERLALRPASTSTLEALKAPSEASDLDHGRPFENLRELEVVPRGRSDWDPVSKVIDGLAGRKTILEKVTIQLPYGYSGGERDEKKYRAKAVEGLEKFTQVVQLR